MSDYNERILEIHSIYAWDYRMVMRAMDFAVENGMNAIAFHRNDFVDKLVYPSRYVGGTNEEGYSNVSKIYSEVFRNVYKYDPLFRDVPYRSGVYFRKVMLEAERRNLKVYIEDKEINFPDYLEGLHPSLRKNGALCPCEPMLFEFIEFKYTELYRLYPGIAGIITSLATSESKTSFAVNHCTCDICKNKDASEWYRDVIMAMYRPIKAAGSRLIIRDFVFDAKSHKGISTAMETLPADIAYALKNTPHDYYPTFPDNPRIGNIPGHEQMIEYDVLGQYFGLGIGIAVMVDDIRRRLKFAREKGASSVLVRTCWEGLTGASVFDTPNMISLYAIAAISKDLNADENEIYDRWLSDKGYYSAGISEKIKSETIEQVKAVFSRTWDVLKRTAFMNQCVFSDSTAYPAGYDHGFWLAEVKNSLRDWDKSKELALSAGDPDNVKHIIAEKDEALSIIEELCAKVRLIGDGITGEARKYFIDCFDAYKLYVRGYRFLGHGMILTRYFLEEKVDTSSEFYAYAVKTLKDALGGLEQMYREFGDLWKNNTDYYFLTYMYLDPERMLGMKEDLERLLKDTAYYANS